MEQLHKQLQITPTDTKILVAFRIWLHTHGFSEQTVFCSDDLREFVRQNKNMQPHFSDPTHDYGSFMAKLKVNKFVVQVGETPSKIPSNHGRKIDVYKWSEL